MRVTGLLMLGWLAFAAALSAFADDAEASKLYDEGRKLYLDGSYYSAGKIFAEAEKTADSNAVKANSLLAQIGAWRMCELYYREFKAIEKLLTLYPEYADFAPLVEREFEIGELYSIGKRDPAFWALRFIPWLVEEDHTEEIFKRALDRAPFSKFSAKAHLRLAYIYDQAGKVRESIAQLREIVRDYPHSPQHKLAMLALAEGLLELSRRGDGDGAYIREAADVLSRFTVLYPDAEEKDWVRRRLLETKDIQAKRLYDMAEFYRKSGRQEAAERYLARIVSELPESSYAAKSEAELVELDSSYVPGDFPPDPDSRLPRIKAYSLPQEARHILISPGVGDHHFLIPVYDLKRDAATEPPAPAPEPDEVKK
jgi:outer membrane protein assembly factor BamD (BamD/ComL family)